MSDAAAAHREQTGIEAFPLCWPQGWNRTQGHARKRSTFRKTFDAARIGVLAEVRRIGGRLPIISSNIPLRLDGMPRGDWARSRIDDPGIAVYFTLKGKQHVVACDTYVSPHENMHAIALSIGCLRGLGRYGASTLMERAFSGFAALPAPARGRTCWDVLGIVNTGSTGPLAIADAYRERARRLHPDVGGTESQMTELNQARDAALREIGA